MDQNNLARVFGPTIVGHGTSEPSPTTIMRDTNTQPKVSSSLSRTPPEPHLNMRSKMQQTAEHMEKLLKVCLSVCLSPLRLSVVCCPSLKPTGDKSLASRPTRPRPVRPTAMTEDTVRSLLVSLFSLAPCCYRVFGRVCLSDPELINQQQVINTCCSLISTLITVKRTNRTASVPLSMCSCWIKCWG